MEFLYITLVLGLFSTNSDCRLQYHKYFSKAYNDSALFLTPYIESGNIEKGRNLARVNLPDMPDVESYAGFFTVNKMYNSNHFLWYFPAVSHNQQAPVLLWLQGGPGGTSLYGLFDENGPIRIRNGTIHKREFHWSLEHHLIYIDNPVGTGFSFTNHSRGHCTDQTQIGEQLYTTLIQFFQLFPELKNNEFYATGESYAGKYVPALSYTIHKKNPSAAVKINLKGLAIGNALCDPVNQVVGIGKYFYQIGLIDWHLAEDVEMYEKRITELTNQQKWIEAVDTRRELLFKLNETTGLISRYNFFLPTDNSVLNLDFEPLLENQSFRKAIHVGNSQFYDGTVVQERLKGDIMKSVANWISELLDHYKVLIYNGQMDTVIAYPWTVNFLRKLNFSGSEEYKTAVRYKWLVDQDLAGYAKFAGNLTEVLVRNAGHMVPRDQPAWALNLITWFTGGIVLNIQ